MKTFEQIKAEWEQPLVGKVGWTEADWLRAYADRAAKLQAELMCLPKWEPFPHAAFSCTLGKKLREYEEKAQQLGVDLWPDHVVEEVETVEWKGVYPGMCLNPAECKGKTHCPRRLSCCE